MVQWILAAREIGKCSEKGRVSRTMTTGLTRVQKESSQLTTHQRQRPPRRREVGGWVVEWCKTSCGVVSKREFVGGS